ncbi:MAG: hypothetical protein Q8K69_04755, partial [Bacteroidota bacterium]|nr:hypothetical protein [Bacteroidota bacterium]
AACGLPCLPAMQGNELNIKCDNKLFYILMPLVLLSIFLLSLHVKGQNLKEFNSKDLLKIQQQSNQNRSDYSENQLARSSPDRQFIQAVIIRNDGTEINDIALRYNVSTNTMQFKRNGTVLDIYETNKIKLIIMGDKVFVYAPYNDARRIRLSYFQLLNEGKYQLLKMYKVVSDGTAEKPMSNDFSSYENATPYYYLRYGDGMANRIDSQKKLIKILQPVPQEVIDYILKYNIKPTDEKELIELMEYINT